MKAIKRTVMYQIATDESKSRQSDNNHGWHIKSKTGIDFIMIS